MNHRSSEHHHHAKHQHHTHAAENYQVRVSTFDLMPPRFTDHGPPNPNIYMTSHGVEARVRPQARREVRVVDYDQRANEYARDGNVKVEEEDIDGEADEFIKHEHRRFAMSKWMSMNGG